MPLPTDIKPPFDHAKALAKVQAAEDAWNSRDPQRVAKAYTEDSQWRNRDKFFRGRAAIERFLADKWRQELDYKLMKELWSYNDNRISVRFEYEWRDETGQWFRTHGNEHWEFDGTGLMRHRDMSANDVPIPVGELRYASPGEASVARLGQGPQVHDHLCGPDPAWETALGGRDV